jgi:DNA-binding NarL/FixJ family response regulator
MRRTVFIVDDHPIIRQGLALLINREQDLSVCGDAEEADSALPVLMLSMPDESLYAEHALRAGANGYIMKQKATERLLIAIRRIPGGEIYVSDRMASRILHRFVGGAQLEQDSSVAELSNRELEVFRLIGEGHDTRQIAEDLHISVKTVESYQAHIKEKLSLKNARELFQRAIQWTVAGKKS